MRFGSSGIIVVGKGRKPAPSKVGGLNIALDQHAGIRTLRRDEGIGRGLALQRNGISFQFLVERPRVVRPTLDILVVKIDRMIFGKRNSPCAVQRRNIGAIKQIIPSRNHRWDRLFSGLQYDQPTKSHRSSEGAKSLDPAIHMGLSKSSTPNDVQYNTSQLIAHPARLCLWRMTCDSWWEGM